MATKNNRRTIITKMLLKEALLALMQEKPIGKITVKDICDSANMSRSTFYLHFQDPYDLLDYIEKEVIEATFENLSRLDTELNSIESIETFLNYVMANKTTFGLLLCQPENQHFQVALLENVKAFIHDSTPEFSDLEKKEFILSFLMHGSLNVIIDWINSNFRLTSRETAEIIYYACKQVLATTES